VRQFLIDIYYIAKGPSINVKEVAILPPHIRQVATPHQLNPQRLSKLIYCFWRRHQSDLAYFEICLDQTLFAAAKGKGISFYCSY